MADMPHGASGLLVRDCKETKADRLVTCTAPGVVAMAAELRGHERQAAEELEQWEASGKERKALRRLAGGDHARPAADR